MANAQHSKQDVTDGIHISHAFEFANTGARTGATYAATDIGKIIRQTDDETWFILTNNTGPVFTQIDAASSPTTHALGGANHSTDSLSNLNSKVTGGDLDFDSADRNAKGIRTATTVVSVSAATAPSTGQVLKATSSTAATWQTEAGGSAVDDENNILANQVFS